MNRITKLASAAMAAVLVGTAGVPDMSAASAEVVTVEAQMLAGSTNISKMTIGKIADQAYTGKAVKPAVSIKNGSSKLKSGTDYTLTYKNNTKLGTASVTIKGKGKYSGTKTVSFNIVPGTSKLSVKTSGSALKFSWSAVKGAESYQLYYSVNGGSYKSLTSTSKTSYSNTKLDPKSNSLSFKVRAYKKSGSKTYYGAWSKAVSAGKAGSSGSSGGISVDKLSTSGKAGTVKFLGFYDITADQKGSKQCELFQSDKFGGNIEIIITSSGSAYYEKLANLIACDDSPDLVEKSAMLYPGNVSKNMFEPLDNYIKFNSSLWKGMKKIADNYSWNGKHYYAPHMTTTSFALNYSKKTIIDNGLADPYELYKKGEWTWDAWRDMMAEFCSKSQDNIGFYASGSGIDAFILTTGTPIVNVSSKGKITNNLTSSNVNRAMQFIETLRKDGLAYNGQLGDWISPQIFATECDKLLFLCMEPEWTYTATAEQLQNPKGVDNDIFDTVSDFAFVPLPKDPQSQTYYHGYDTFGYLIPRGAKNIKGAVEFINLNRAYQLDPKLQKQVKNDHVAPEKIYFDKGANQGKQKWQITWGEQEYDLLKEMSDPASFSFVSEGAYGFNTDLQYQIDNIVMDIVAYNPWAQYNFWDEASKEFSPIIDSVIADYK